MSRMAAVQSPAPQRLTDNNVLFIGDSLTNPFELTECRINGDMLHLEGMLGQRGLTEAKIWLQQTAPSVGAPHTSCTKAAGRLYSCTNSVREAGYSRTRVRRVAACIVENQVCELVTGLLPGWMVRGSIVPHDRNQAP